MAHNVARLFSFAISAGAFAVIAEYWLSPGGMFGLVKALYQRQPEATPKKAAMMQSVAAMCCSVQSLFHQIVQ